MLRTPWPAPWWNSPTAARSASLARCTAAPVVAPSRSLSGTLRQPWRLGGLTRTPRLRSIGPGDPIAIEVTFWPPRRASSVLVTQATKPGGPPRSAVWTLRTATMRPSERDSATRACVPPRSMPAIIVAEGSPDPPVHVARVGAEAPNGDRRSRAQSAEDPGIADAAGDPFGVQVLEERQHRAA